MTDQHDDSAGVHAWTELLTRIRFGTQKTLGKTVSGARIHAVGERVARYATHATGADVHPGLARIAVDLEMDYRTVKAAVAVLVRAGLLRLVVAASRPGDADEYQLTIPADLLDRMDVEVWSPARHRLEMEKVREKVRGKYKPANLRGPDGPQEETTQPVDDPQPAGASRAADDTPAAQPAGAAEAAEIQPAGASRANLRPVRPPPPPTDHVDNYDHPTGEKVRTAVTGPRATASKPDSPVDEEQTQPGPLRLIEGNPNAPAADDIRGLWPSPVDAEPASPARGHGFCLPCHAQGHYTVAADPIHGAQCAHHLRSA